MNTIDSSKPNIFLVCIDLVGKLVTWCEPICCPPLVFYDHKSKKLAFSIDYILSYIVIYIIVSMSVFFYLFFFLMKRDKQYSLFFSFFLDFCNFVFFLFLDYYHYWINTFVLEILLPINCYNFKSRLMIAQF